MNDVKKNNTEKSSGWADDSTHEKYQTRLYTYNLSLNKKKQQQEKI